MHMTYHAVRLSRFAIRIKFKFALHLKINELTLVLGVVDTRAKSITPTSNNLGPKNHSLPKEQKNKIKNYQN